MTYIVLDTETTTHNTVGKNKANPHSERNRMVALGWKQQDCPVATVYFNTEEEAQCISFEAELLIGHNLGFDLKYLLRQKNFRKIFSSKSIWCTQLAEYLLTAQQENYPSLDFCAAKRGGVLKDDRLSVLWDSGMSTEDIPQDMLVDYLKSDVENTEKVFLSQVKEASEKKMLPFIKSQMDALMATTEMSMNGIKVDKDLLADKFSTTSFNLANLKALIEGYARGLSHPDFEWGSRKALSLLLFGGTYDFVEDIDDGFYKNGNPKTKRVVTKKKYVGMGFQSRPEWIGANGIVSTDVDVLGECLNAATGIHSRVIEWIMEAKKLEKELSTYIEGIQKATHTDGFVHQSLNHVVTRTGRLSCTDPNLQNQTESHIKEVFVPRNSEEGCLIEADFGQLEIVALAYLSQDTVLIAELNAGIDIHSALYEKMYGRAPTTEERKQFKRLTFALVYGAGAKTMAVQSGLPVPVCKKYIEVFYNKYIGVKEYHSYSLAVAEVGCALGTKKTESGLPAREYTQRLETGRRLHYTQYDSTWTKKASFSPTELKNYPVQSFATGDIVPLVLGYMYRALIQHPILSDKLLMINTIHDSIMFDLLDKTLLPESVKFIKDLMTSADKMLEETFGIKLGLKLTCSIKHGPNWFEMKDYKEGD